MIAQALIIYKYPAQIERRTFFRKNVRATSISAVRRFPRNPLAVLPRHPLSSRLVDIQLIVMVNSYVWIDVRALPNPGRVEIDAMWGRLWLASSHGAARRRREASVGTWPLRDSQSHLAILSECRRPEFSGRHTAGFTDKAPFGASYGEAREHHCPIISILWGGAVEILGPASRSREQPHRRHPNALRRQRSHPDNVHLGLRFRWYASSLHEATQRRAGKFLPELRKSE